MMKFTYLLIDLGAFIVPFLFSFHPKLKFNKKWGALFPAIIFSAIFFIPFDMYFTKLKVWGFNPIYISGYHIGNLPVEELLFFICIPYSCIFTYYCLSPIFIDTPAKLTNIFTGLLIGISAFLLLIFRSHAYTLFAFILIATLLFAAQFIFKVNWLTKFYYTYAILLLPFLIVNGLLTGTGLSEPIVWYNNAENMNLRILTIPVEDIFYGMGLILLNLMIFQKLNKTFFNNNKSKRNALRLDSQIKSVAE
jgi:lycopene cyclase domain-containing protein